MVDNARRVPRINELSHYEMVKYLSRILFVPENRVLLAGIISLTTISKALYALTPWIFAQFATPILNAALPTLVDLS
jgi:hypothetical protein